MTYKKKSCNDDIKYDVPNFILVNQEFIYLFSKFCNKVMNKINSFENNQYIQDVDLKNSSDFAIIDNQTGLVINKSKLNK